MPAIAASIALAPFENLSGDPSQDVLALGFVEDVTSALSRFGAIEVVYPHAFAATFPGRSGSNPPTTSRKFLLRAAQPGNLRTPPREPAGGANVRDVIRPRNPENPFYRMDQVYLDDGSPINPEGEMWVDLGLGGFLRSVPAWALGNFQLDEEAEDAIVPFLKTLSDRPVRK